VFHDRYTCFAFGFDSLIARSEWDVGHPEVSPAWLLSSRIPGLESSG
jgi:hypothetical protein